MTSFNLETFSFFEQFPPEIKHSIWTASLPDVDDPTLYFFSWRTYAFFIKGPPNPMRHGHITRRPSVQVPMPELVFVNREARDVTMRWARKRGYELVRREETAGHILVREWDPSKDPLYVPRARWAEWADVPSTYGDLDLLGPMTRHIAVSAFSGYYGTSSLAFMWDFMPNLETISVIWDAAPRPRFSASSKSRTPLYDMGELEVQPRWELQNVEEDAEVRMSFENQDDNEAERQLLGPEEEGEVSMFMEELVEQLASEDLPEHAWDEDAGLVLPDIIPVNAARR